MALKEFYFRVKKFLHLVSNLFFLKALINGSAAGVEHLSILKKIKCLSVIDIGANRGQFALAARSQFPQSKIISFEPLTEPANVFRRVFKSDPLTCLHQIAIGPEEKYLSMHVSRADDSSSFLPISTLQSKLFPGTEEREIRMVKIAPLLSVLDVKEIISPALLKIDVQGFELDVLKGCEDSLDKFTQIYIECSFVELYDNQALAHDIISWLEKRGFFLSGIYNLSYYRDNTAIQGDFLFSKSKKFD